MNEIEIPEFNVGKDGTNDKIATFNNTCVYRVEIIPVSADGESWVEITQPGWINYITNSSYVTVNVRPIGDDEDRECVLSALTYDSDNELISAGTCGYMVKVIQKRNTSPYDVPTNEDDMPQTPTLPSYRCEISGVSGGQEEDNKYVVPYTGGDVIFESKNKRTCP